MPSDTPTRFDPTWSDPATEAVFLDALSLDEGWRLIERFATLTRESGSDDERTAATYLAERLEALGVPFEVLEPELYLSIPRSAELRVHGVTEQRFDAATPAFSTSTGPAGARAAAVHASTGYATSTVTVFDAGDASDLPDVRGKIAVTEGFANPGKVEALAEHGAIGVVCINPGAYVHEGICTPIWGAPDARTAHRQPRVPVVAISRPDGDELLAAMARGAEVTITTELDEGWMRCPLVVTEVRGAERPDEFVLLHGHIDSWYVGIGDNATGNATLLELARVLQLHRERLRRSVRIAWWPGHSTGRYAGSTWYADRFALELDEHCVAHVNCDSPGCRDASAYENVMWMAEAEPLALGAIRDATGQSATGARPFRAGDISFNNLGLSTFFMLSSEIPAEELQRRGSYPVGGCGMNIEWHTPHDTLEIADRDILMKDMRVYLLGVLRAANATLSPLDYRRTLAEMRDVIRGYAATSGDVDLEPVVSAIDVVDDAVARMYRDEVVGDDRVDAFNLTQRRLGRRLVSLNFSQAGKFRQDPALQVPALPELASARGLSDERDPHRRRVLETEGVRARNRALHELREVALEVGRYLGGPRNG